MSTTITPDTPAMPPPAGQTSNFTNPPDYYQWVLGVGITSMAIMTVSIYMRTYTKAIILKDVRHEDYVAILALLSFLTWNAIYIYLASIGITRDLWNIRAMDMAHMLYLMNVIQVLYSPAMLCAKYFILVQLRRIFCVRGVKGPVWWAIHTLMTATVIYYFSCFWVFLFQCVPREKIWNPMVKGTCINQNGAVMSAGTINLALDIGTLIIPIWAIWHLQMPLKNKLGVTSLFAVGFITCGMAAAGVAFRVPLMTVANQTNASAKVGLWSFAEYTGTILVGCMPMMPRFYDVNFKPIISRISQTSLRSLTSSRRSQAPRNGSGSNPSIKPLRNVAVDSANSESELGYDYVKLRDPSTSSIIHEAKPAF